MEKFDPNKTTRAPRSPAEAAADTAEPPVNLAQSADGLMESDFFFVPQAQDPTASEARMRFEQARYRLDSRLHPSRDPSDLVDKLSQRMGLTPQKRMTLDREETTKTFETFLALASTKKTVRIGVPRHAMAASCDPEKKIYRFFDPNVGVLKFADPETFARVAAQLIDFYQNAYVRYPVAKGPPEGVAKYLEAPINQSMANPNDVLQTGICAALSNHFAKFMLENPDLEDPITASQLGLSGLEHFEPVLRLADRLREDERFGEAAQAYQKVVDAQSGPGGVMPSGSSLRDYLRLRTAEKHAKGKGKSTEYRLAQVKRKAIESKIADKVYAYVPGTSSSPKESVAQQESATVRARPVAPLSLQEMAKEVKLAMSAFQEQNYKATQLHMRAALDVMQHFPDKEIREIIQQLNDDNPERAELIADLALQKQNMLATQSDDPNDEARKQLKTGFLSALKAFSVTRHAMPSFRVDLTEMALSKKVISRAR